MTFDSISCIVVTVGQALSKEETIDNLKSLGQSYMLVRELEDLAARAASGDEAAFEVLETMLSECEGTEPWLQNSRWCSAVIHSLVRTGSSRSMMLLVHYIKKLPEGSPFGPIDLLSSLLPSYGRIITGPAREMTAEENPSSVRAVGIQTLCNLYLEGMLSQNDLIHLSEILKDFKSDRYFSQHHADMVRTAMQKTSVYFDDDQNFTDFLVEQEPFS